MCRLGVDDYGHKIEVGEYQDMKEEIFQCPTGARCIVVRQKVRRETMMWFLTYIVLVCGRLSDVMLSLMLHRSKDSRTSVILLLSLG